jgi:hypothetical protein
VLFAVKGDFSKGMFTADHEYPASPDEVLNPPMKFKAGTLKAMRQFKDAKPWRGNQQERIAKFTALVTELSQVYGIQPPMLDASSVDSDESSDRSFYVPMLHSIHLVGKLSVITLLHEFSHALGKNEHDACRWSLNLFKRVFPKQWERLTFQGHVARRRTSR